MFSLLRFRFGVPFFRKTLAFISLIPLAVSSLHGENAEKNAPGIAWHVQGNWLVEGKGVPIRVGDAIRPESLLQPDDPSASHSVTVLLPDGQRNLYECFTVADCARGFRVPSLISKPDSFSIVMLARIREAFSSRQTNLSSNPREENAPQTSRDEAVAVLDPNNRVQVGGLLAQLPNGRYTYDLHPLSHAFTSQFHVGLEKTAASVNLSLPSTGLYEITISDALDTPRINLFLAAITPAQSPEFASFQHAKAVMTKWNKENAGWPIHDFLRAYLQSLKQRAKPMHSGK